MEDDYVTYGESGLVARGNGWYLNTNTGYLISPEGDIFNQHGDKVDIEDEVDNSDG